MPVHRHSHGSGGTIYAYTSELDRWLSVRSKPGESPCSPRRWRALWLIIALAVAAIASTMWLHLRAGRPVTSLAVLPFSAEGNGPNWEYLIEGLPESITRGLSQLDGLRVKVLAQSAVERLQRPLPDVENMGRLLKVDAILRGHLTQQDDKLTVRVELIRVSDQSLLWADRFEATWADVPKLQEGIAREIASRLHLRLIKSEKELPARTPTTSVEAHRHYLRGRYHWNRRTAGGLDLAVRYFERAIEADPSYALAYAGLAESYAVRSYYAAVPPGESATRSIAAARKAIDIDSTISEAWNALAYMESDYEWRWDLADQHFRRALALDPNNATAHHWYSEHLAALGRFDDEQREIERAAELDPLSLIIANNLGHVWYFRRRMDQAADIHRKAMAEFPQLPNAHQDLGKIYLVAGRYADAIREFQLAESLGGTHLHAGLLGLAYGWAGEHQRARDIQTSLLRRGERDYVSPYVMALVSLGLSQKEQALQWLEKAAEERTPTLKWIGVEPMFDSLRGEPRFQAILQRMGLPIRTAELPSVQGAMP